MSNYEAKRLRAKLVERKGKCAYCGRGLTYEDSTVDHVIPISAGGVTSRENVVLSCVPCNEEKGDRFPDRDLVERLFREDAFLPPRTSAPKQTRHPKRSLGRGGRQVIQGTPLAVLLGA